MTVTYKRRFAVASLAVAVIGGTASAVSFTTDSASAAATGLVISEFRVHGPNGANDEFIEIANPLITDHTVTASSGTGYGVAASDGVARCSIPNGTKIPARGHFLCVNSVGYSLASYPAGNGATATGDATYTTDIPDNAGIALFDNNTGGGSYTLATRLDAVGSTSEANTLYKEGTGYPALAPASPDYSFYRNITQPAVDADPPTPTAVPPGVPQDTNNNADDFLFVDTNGVSAGAGQRLGAPGPENLSSPITGDGLVVTPLDPCVADDAPPNAVRDFTADPANNSTEGTIDIRRTITNNTGSNVTRLRLRIGDIRTFPAPNGFADMRPRTSTAVVVTVDRAPCGSGTSNVTVQGTTLEQPPSQLNGGGFNSSLSAGTVTLATPLANGASIDVRMLFGIQQTGKNAVNFVVEALPDNGGGAPVVYCAGDKNTGEPNICAGAQPPNPDPDGDGLSNAKEASLGSNPQDPDTDNDGLKDGTEYNGFTMAKKVIGCDRVKRTIGKVRTYLLKRDSDGDGINDRQEAFGITIYQRVVTPNGTYILRKVSSHPRRIDTDGDGLKDRVEISGSAAGRFNNAQTDPANCHTDYGKRSDGYELARGKNPVRSGEA